MRTGLSFSGGKDSTFALYRLKEQGISAACLITTIWKEYGETVAHGEKLERLKQQANQLGIPLELVVTDFESYTTDYKQKLMELKHIYKLEAIAYGDIYLEGHRKWGEELAKSVDLKSLYPLWTDQDKAIQLLYDFVASGFKSRVIKVDEEKLPKEWVGREVDMNFIRDIQTYDVCPLGESGEYHTHVYDGPIFYSKSHRSEG